MYFLNLFLIKIITFFNISALLIFWDEIQKNFSMLLSMKIHQYCFFKQMEYCINSEFAKTSTK
ncbi:LOW QUALITY PROTEIN: hypothetical protein HZS_1580 [Henneguya salminicola]|nr:LOW QUALITY PROTEIN: hypothetical protein HZS_1580 [Henneguya salminicola]